MTVFNGKNGQIELMSAQGMLDIIKRFAFFDMPKADNIEDGTRLLAQMPLGIIDQYRRLNVGISIHGFVPNTPGIGGNPRQNAGAAKLWSSKLMIRYGR